MILAIDPGNIDSAFVVLDKNLRPISFEKIDNRHLLERIHAGEFSGCQHVAIEMIASYGMAVGKTVFDTCVWVGRFTEAVEQRYGKTASYIYRKEEKLNLCYSTKAKDGNVIQALIDRFAPDIPNKGKGSKKEPGWFYGFAKDVWQAYAVGVTYYDLYVQPLKNNIIKGDLYGELKEKESLRPSS